MSADERAAIKPYPKAAGGVDALKASVAALRKHDALISGARTLLDTNQPGGFDCPGCAWPDRNPHATFAFCENGVKAVAHEATGKRALREFFAAHTVTELLDWSDHDLEAIGRLTEPLAWDSTTDRYQPIRWDDAFARIAQALHALASPHEALFYTSGRTSNEAAFLYQLFVRKFGTNNLPDCSNLCHESSGVAMTEQLGSGKGSVLLEDFEQAQAIFVFGQNPGTNHPRMLGELRHAAKRGCRIVAFNPMRERGLERFADPKSLPDLLGDGVALASQYHQLRIGGDLAALTGIAKCVLDADALDHAFIAAHTQGFDAFVAAIRATDWAGIERESGLGRQQIAAAAEVYMRSNATIFCWGMGITQHTRAVATIQMLVNVLLLRGNIGKPGAGPCPVRGHSNVQGDRTMGIYEKMPDAFLDRLGEVFDFQPPRAHGFDSVGAIRAMHDGHASVFIGMGGNFASATPDTALTHAALRNCALTAHVSTTLNRSHLVHGRQALILPCLGRTEIDVQATGPQAVTVEDSMSTVHLSSGVNPPASEQLLSEPAIVARLAEAVLPADAVPWRWLAEDYDRIRERIAQVVPGFENFNARVRHPGGFHLHHPNRERRFPNAPGRALFCTHPLRSTHLQAAGDLLQLMTVRSHDQYNTTVYGLDDRYRGVRGMRRVCFISPADLQRLGLEDGQHVDLVSVWDDGERRVEDFRLVTYPLPPGCLAAYYPETNPLVPLDHHAERSRTPASKSIPVRLQPRPTSGA